MTADQHPAGRVCAWCHVKLAAVPDEPVPHLGALYHRSCVRAVRILGEHRRQP